MEMPIRQIIAYPPRFMAAAEAARYLGIGETTLREQGPTPVALGRRRLYDINALNRWADRLSGQPLDDIADQSETENVERRFLEKRRGHG